MLKPWRAEPDHTALFLQRYPALLAQARRVFKLPREQATELVHEAFLHFVVSQPELEAIDQLDAYLFGMLRKLHVSGLRRLARQRTLPMGDYDSAALALRDTAGVAALQALQALQEVAQVCAYCATRRHTSKAGSVLAFRYFHGRSPAALAVMLRVSAATVKQWLHLARREAREYLADPERSAAFGPVMLPPRIGLAVAPEERLAAFVAWLRRYPVGRCLQAEELDALRAARPLGRAALAHLVSCADCLATIDHLTHGDHRAGPPDEGDGAAVGSGGRPASRSAAAAHRHRVIEFRAHRPSTLCVHVNGFLVGSQRLTSGVTDFTTRVHLDEPIAFVEVLSEQGVRLALVESVGLGVPADGTARLDGNRSLDVTVDISEAWPGVTVRYVDPHFEPVPADLEAPIDVDDPATETPRTSEAAGLGIAMPRRWPGAWSWRALVWRLAFVLLAVWIAASPSQAAALVSGAWNYVVAVVERLVGVPPLSSRPIFAPGAGAFAATAAAPAPTAATATGAGTTIDLDALEIDLLSRIDGVGGLLGDEVAVDRIEAPGHPRLLVRAVLSDTSRKLEILAALGASARRPAVTLDISTAEEVLAAGRARAALVSAPQLRTGQLLEPRVPAFEAMRDALLQLPEPPGARAIDAEVRRFAMEVLQRSLRARLHAGAAAALVGRFVDRWPSLPTAARQQRAHLVSTHVRGVEDEAGALRVALGRTFAWPAAESPEADLPRSGEAGNDLLAAARELAAVMTAYDMSIGRAFAVSTDAAGDLAVTRPAFGDSLRDAERRARHLLARLDRISAP